MKVRAPALPLFVFKTNLVQDNDFFFLQQTYCISEELLNHEKEIISSNPSFSLH